MWYDTLGSIILISLATLSILLVILIAVEPYFEPNEIYGVEGVITDVFISDWETYYVFNGESYNINTLYNSNDIEIKLFTPCEIIYGKSVIWGREKIIALEYLEVE